MYCHAFLEHEISGSELMSLERSDFKDAGVTKVSLSVDIESFWTEGYAGQIPNSGHELAIHVLWLRAVGRSENPGVPVVIR